jgi:hypothetical protein
MKSDFPEGRFLAPKFEIQTGPFQPSLLIVDYVWWTDNEEAILSWMDERLPNGRSQQQGMVILFNNDQDRLMFLMRWQ